MVFDRAALAGGVAAFEQDHDLESAGLDPLLELHQLHVEAGELGQVVLEVELLAGILALVGFQGPSSSAPHGAWRPPWRGCARAPRRRPRRPRQPC